MSNPAELYRRRMPPTASGEHQVLSVATAGTAANYNWVTGLSTDAPKGTVHLLLEAITQDCYVRFKPTATTALTAVNTGLIIKAGERGRVFWVDPVNHAVIDFIAGGAGVLKIQVCSKIGARRDV